MLKNARNGKNQEFNNVITSWYMFSAMLCHFRAEKIPDSCTDARHQAFAFMMMACSYSCKIREVRGTCTRL